MTSEWGTVASPLNELLFRLPVILAVEDVVDYSTISLVDLLHVEIHVDLRDRQRAAMPHSPTDRLDGDIDVQASGGSGMPRPV